MSDNPAIISPGESRCQSLRTLTLKDAEVHGTTLADVRAGGRDRRQNFLPERRPVLD